MEDKSLPPKPRFSFHFLRFEYPHPIGKLSYPDASQNHALQKWPA